MIVQAHFLININALGKASARKVFIMTIYKTSIFAEDLITDYEKAEKTAFATGIIPDGYFGDKASVKFGLIDQTVITITESGYFRTGLPSVIDKAEAYWLLEHHPSSNAKKLALI